MPDDIAFAHFALAGDDVEDDQIRLTELLALELPGVKFHVTNDVWAGLRAGSIDGTGIAVNCGSGAGAVGRSVTGAQLMIPDLGYMYGDSGGGNQIGVDAIRAVVRAWDGRGDATALADAVLSLVDLPDTAALYLALYRGQVGGALIRQCTRLVFQCASRGDTVSIEILTRIGAEFGRSAVALARRLNMEDQEFPFVLTGGAIRTLQSPLVEAAVAHLRSVCPRCQPTSPRLMPVAGAALLALDASEVPVTDEHFLRLQTQGQAWHPEEIYACSVEE
jgi:N-acetylglucosamine kinase-like BadF-type ATPase